MGEGCSGNDNGFALNWFPGRLLDFFPNRSSHFPVLADLDLTVPMTRRRQLFSAVWFGAILVWQFLMLSLASVRRSLNP
jgi:hypothetical protein